MTNWDEVNARLGSARDYNVRQQKPARRHLDLAGCIHRTDARFCGRQTALTAEKTSGSPAQQACGTALGPHSLQRLSISGRSKELGSPAHRTLSDM